jgi:hypothetical protein
LILGNSNYGFIFVIEKGEQIMANREDQATLLRQQMEAIQDHEEQTEHQIVDHEFAEQDMQMDILELPPRSVKHEDNKAKTRWKISLVLVRFITVLFLIIIGLILSYHFWGDHFLQSAEHNVTPSSQVGETVQIISNAQSLLRERTIQIQLDPNSKERTTINGKYYFSEEGDTVESLTNRFYHSVDMIPLVKKINGLTENELEKNQRIFLPDVINQD